MSDCTVERYLALLKDVDSALCPVPAEILDDRVRDIISPGRISTHDWIRVIRAAHSLGLPTTATIMYGHVESARDRVKHLDLIRTLQKETGKFTEFVPLSFIATEAPMFLSFLVLVSLLRGGSVRRRSPDVCDLAFDVGSLDSKSSGDVGEAGGGTCAGVSGRWGE